MYISKKVILIVGSVLLFVALIFFAANQSYKNSDEYKFRQYKKQQYNMKMQNAVEEDNQRKRNYEMMREGNRKRDYKNSPYGVY